VTWTTAAIAAGASVSVGILTALTALYSSKRTSKQAISIAREQRRYERVHDMRAEVLPQIYADVYTLHDVCTSLAKRPLGANPEGGVDVNQLTEALQEMDLVIDKALKKLDEMEEYYRNHILWIPREVEEAQKTAFSGLVAQFRKISQAQSNLRLQIQQSLQDEDADPAERRKRIVRAIREAEDVRRVVGVWLGTVGEEQQETVRVSAENILIREG
jgi:hypothetical protein